MMKNGRNADHTEALKQYCFKELRLSGREMELLRLSAGQGPSPGELSAYYETVVFDELQGQHACALASLSQKLDFQGVPDNLVPRVKGIFRYHSARNAMQMKELLSLLKKLNEADADVMLLDGAAMKAHYMPHAVRFMGMISFRTRNGGTEKAINTLEEAGEYTVKSGEHQTVIIRNQQKPPIQFICLNDDSGMNHGEEIIWEDAAETSFQGERVFIPARETLLLLILSDVFQSVLGGGNHRSGRIQWAQDSAFLLGDDRFSWERLRELCRRSDLSAEILIMLKILNDLFPAHIPEEAFSHFPVSAAEKKRMTLLLRFFRIKERHEMYVRAFAGKRKSPRYCFHLLRLYWYKNRCLGKRSGLAADVLSFPSFLKASFSIGTWKDFIRLFTTKLREPICAN